MSLTFSHEKIFDDQPLREEIRLSETITSNEVSKPSGLNPYAAEQMEAKRSFSTRRQRTKNRLDVLNNMSQILPN